MGVQDIIVFLIVAGCLFYAGRHLLSFLKKVVRGADVDAPDVRKLVY